MMKQDSQTIAQASAAAGRLGIPKTYKLYIDGKFPRTESGRYFVYDFKDGSGSANLCLSSRKDLRDAVSAARAAFAKWSQATAYNRGQILYRIGEILESRRAQFIEELRQQGLTEAEAKTEINQAIDRWVYYAGWADKYQQVFSAVNPVAASYFNFSVYEPTGVVGVIAPDESPLLGLASVVAPIIAGGNVCVVLASGTRPLSAITLAEVLHSSDVPAGVVNFLTGTRKELVNQFATHMDVNALVVVPNGENAEEAATLQTQSAGNVKRLVSLADWDQESPYTILQTQEVKTTWHPIGV